MTKYLFLDVDGTLYSPRIGRIPDSAQRALSAARKQGHKIFLCTGRSLAEASVYLNYPVDGFIFGAGAMIYADGKKIYDHPMKKEDVTFFKHRIAELGAGYSLEGSAGAYCSDKGYEALLWYFAGGAEDKETRIASCMHNCTYTEEHGSEECDAIYKICAFAPYWEPLYPELIASLKEPYILTQSMKLEDPPFCIGEVTDGRITKATGIERVLEYYHASGEDAYGFGDSSNDIPMFTVCGTGIAMGNGTEEIKAAADYITADILEDGLYKAFVYFGLIEEEE